MERVEDALARELEEELGIDVEVEALLCVTNHIVHADNAHWVSPAYLVRVISEFHAISSLRKLPPSNGSRSRSFLKTSARPRKSALSAYVHHRDTENTE
jgi:ADP-ribose pyrophosphatase YjhB (NUDIX family)